MISQFISDSQSGKSDGHTQITEKQRQTKINRKTDGQVTDNKLKREKKKRQTNRQEDNKTRKKEGRK